MMTTKEEALNRVLSKVKVERHVNGVYHCICPNHKDDKPSLHISMGDVKVVLDCKAGCEYSDILESIGMKPEQLYYDYYQKRDSSKPDWRKFVESKEKKRLEAVYHYTRLDGEYAFSKLRFEGKKIIYGVFVNEKFKYGLPRDTPRKSFKAIYGDVKAIKQAITDNKTVFVVEGEKDVNSLKKRGYASFTYGGVCDWQTEFAEILHGANVVILADNDTPGLKVANQILDDIQSVVKSAKVIVPMPDTPKADITDYFESGHTKEEFEQMVASSNAIENVSEKQIKQSENLLESVLREIKAEQFESTDKGFGRLFATVFKSKHRYNPSRKDFMLYNGKKWVDDVEGLSARSSAKDLSDALVRYAVSVDTDGKYLKAVTPLCNIRNRNNMLQDSRDIFYFTNEELDKNDYLLNVQNGTVDLSGSTPQFLKHSPDLLLSKICNVNYDPDATCKEWGKFLYEIMQGDEDKIRYLQKIAGLSLTGNTQEETCFILYGSTTRNGKSTFCETLIYMLGDYALTMKPETLAIKQNLDSRQASGDIARLAGCRFCNASEPPKRMLFDTALLKSLLGRDSVTARHLHQREFSFIPKFKLVINTNYLPTVADDTVFSSGRINVISFDRHFEPQEQDKTLKDRLRKEEELSGILNWCIEGLRLYREEGLKPPNAICAATEQYRHDSDKIGNFISECLCKTGKNSKAKDVYEVYTKWCDDNGYGCENKGNFFSELKAKNIYSASGTVDGKTVKNIVKGYSIDTDFEEISSAETTPFD